MANDLNELLARVSEIIHETDDSGNIDPSLIKAIHQYEEMQKLGENDLESDDFQKAFSKFYVLRRNKEFKDHFFSYLSEIKNRENIEIKEVIEKLKEAPGNIELSFSSKLLNTIDPDLYPIWDSNIEKVLRKYFSGELKKIDTKDSLDLASQKYEVLRKFYKELETKGIADELVELFNNSFPGSENCIPKMKKIDFILWSYGKSLDKSQGRSHD